MLPVIQIAIAILVVLIVYCYYKKLQNARIEKFLKSYPSPPALPIVGHAFEFESSEAFLNKLHEYVQKYGKILPLNFGPFAHDLVVADYKLFEFLLSTNKVLKKGTSYQFLEPWLGTGLLTSYGQKWKSHRRLITPAFHFKILEEFIEIFSSNSDILIEKLKEKDGTKSLDIYPYITLCALDAICESAMGVKVNAQDNEQVPYVWAVKEMARILVDRARSVVKRSNFLFMFTQDYRIQRKSLKILHDYTNKVIDQKIKEMQENQENSKQQQVDDTGVKKKRAFLNLLLESTIDGQPLTRTEIREEVDTFMFEGHDTTASAMTFAIYCLAQYKDVQDKVYEEQVQLFDNEKNPNVTYQDLQNMNYLELVIKEVLRLYPSVPIIGRETDEDVEYDGKIIPKGVQFTIFFHGIHRDPEFFPEPEQFKPERFEEKDGKFPYSYLPFSAGSRNCIGQKFAMLEIKSLVSKIVRHFEVFPAEPTHEMKIAPETVLISKNGIKVGLKSRA